MLYLLSQLLIRVMNCKLLGVSIELDRQSKIFRRTYFLQLLSFASRKIK